MPVPTWLAADIATPSKQFAMLNDVALNMSAAGADSLLTWLGPVLDAAGVSDPAIAGSPGSPGLGEQLVVAMHNKEAAESATSEADSAYEDVMDQIAAGMGG